jgi:hypothetical protein
MKEAAMQVWILMQGEFGEGGSVEGVFASRELGHGAFAKLAAELHDRFGIRDADVREDGGLYLNGGCDWIELRPFDVVEQLAIAAE